MSGHIVHNESSSHVTQSNGERCGVVYSYPSQEHSFVKCNGVSKISLFFLRN